MSQENEPPSAPHAAPPREERKSLPTLAGRYRLLRRIGRGGMGSVYRAFDLSLRRQVAVKVIRPDLVDKSDVMKRFLQEAAAAATISHPNVVQVYDIAQDDARGEAFIVQELLDGTSLHELNRQGPMPPIAAIELLMPVMLALQTAHEKGVIHRDVKPENILLVKGPNGLTPKVIDFGIARVLDEHGESLSKTVGAMPGTPLYMSPEHARGQKDLDGRTDVWSLGVVLYVLLTGRQPFFGDSVRQVVWKVLHESPPPVWELARHLPPCVCELVHTALEHDPARRYATMRDFHAAAERCVDELKKPPAPAPREEPRARPDARFWASRLAFVAALLFAASLGFALALPRSHRANAAAGGTIRRNEVAVSTSAGVGRSSPRITTTVLALVSDAAVVEKPVTPPPPRVVPRHTATETRSPRDAGRAAPPSGEPDLNLNTNVQLN